MLARDYSSAACGGSSACSAELATVPYVQFAKRVIPLDHRDAITVVLGQRTSNFKLPPVAASNNYKRSLACQRVRGRPDSADVRMRVLQRDSDARHRGSSCLGVIDGDGAAAHINDLHCVVMAYPECCCW